MILSHRHKLIFLKTRKVAGTSVEMALSRYCGPEDIITPFSGKRDPINSKEETQRQHDGGPGSQHYLQPLREYRATQILRLQPWRRPKRKFYEHMPAAELQGLLPAQIWRDYLKVSIIRNPFDFAVSDYFWYKRFRGFDGSFEDFLTSKPNALRINERITSIDGQSAVDVMMRYETLSEDLSRLSRQLGLNGDLGADFRAVTALKGVRPAGTPAGEMYRSLPQGIAQIERLCQSTIETYGYRLST